MVIPDVVWLYSVLRELHASHLGMIKMKQFARSYFWWPCINNDIEEITGKCRYCLESRPDTSEVIFTPWQWPSKAWSRIHADFC